MGPATLVEALILAKSVGIPVEEIQLTPTLRRTKLTKQIPYMQGLAASGLIKIAEVELPPNLRIYERSKVIPVAPSQQEGLLLPDDLLPFLADSTGAPRYHFLQIHTREVTGTSHPWKPNERTLVLVRRPPHEVLAYFFGNTYLRNMSSTATRLEGPNRGPNRVILFQILNIFDLKEGLLSYANNSQWLKEFRARKQIEKVVAESEEGTTSPNAQQQDPTNTILFIPFLNAGAASAHAQSIEELMALWDKLTQADSPQALRDLLKSNRNESEEMTQFLDDCCVFMLIPGQEWAIHRENAEPASDLLIGNTQQPQVTDVHLASTTWTALSPLSIHLPRRHQ